MAPTLNRFKLAYYRRWSGWALFVVAVVAFLTAGQATAQTFTDPAPGLVRVVVSCGGTSLTSGEAQTHLHGFGGARVGRPRETNLPLLRCTPDAPTNEMTVAAAIPPIWHAYLTVNGAATCELEGSTYPARGQCGDDAAFIIVEIETTAE